MRVETLEWGTDAAARPRCRECAGQPARIVCGLPAWPPEEGTVFGGLAVDAADPTYFCEGCRRYCADDGGTSGGGSDPLDLG